VKNKLHSLPEFRPSSRRAWRAWLQKHHGSSAGVWLVYAKKDTGLPTLTYDDSVEEALCFGWIDSLRHPVDDRFWRMVFTPRKPKSVWSASNRERVARLVAAGRMTPAGQALIDLARESGTWEALLHVDSLTAPADLQRAIDANAAARKNWPNCSPALKKAFLYRLSSAKRQETRAKRIAGIVAVVARNLTMADLRAGKATIP
jgi:uncharacterized protein YdeI (YjbR/CyaY-like superfamily)